MARQKRDEIRVLVNKLCHTHCWERGVAETISNISSSGCKLLTNIVYELGDVIGLTMDNKHYIGVVVRKNHVGYGIKFIYRRIKDKNI